MKSKKLMAEEKLRIFIRKEAKKLLSEKDLTKEKPKGKVGDIIKVFDYHIPKGEDPYFDCKIISPIELNDDDEDFPPLDSGNKKFVW